MQDLEVAVAVEATMVGGEVLVLMGSGGGGSSFVSSVFFGRFFYISLSEIM